MPVYRNSFELCESGNGNVVVHVFDFIGDTKRQMISVKPCITLGTQTLDLLDDPKMSASVLKPGVVFEGYYIRTTGEYDYCYKMWTKRYLPFAPLNARLPQDDQEQDSLLIDCNEDYFGLACGQHLAFCKVHHLKEKGFTEDTKLPAVGPKVFLKLVKEGRPSEIPYAAFEASLRPFGEESPRTEEERVEELETPTLEIPKVELSEDGDADQTPIPNVEVNGVIKEDSEEEEDSALPPHHSEIKA